MKQLAWKYTLLIITALASELIMGRLALGQWFVPLLYLAPLIVMPTTFVDEESNPAKYQFNTLLLGIAIGLVSDIMMGTLGLNTIAAMATAMVRRPLLRRTADPTKLRTITLVIPATIGHRAFWGFASLLITIHCLIFFIFETLTVNHILYTAGRIAIAWGAVMLFTWMILPIIPRKTARKRNIYSL